MKIVHWAKYYPPEWGGTELVTYDEATASAAAGDDVCVVAFTRAETRKETDKGVYIERAKVSASIDSQPLSLRWFLAAVRQAFTADVVHIHTPNLLAAPALLLVPPRPRVILQWQTDVVEKGLLGKLVRPLELFMAWRADLILANSEAYAAASVVLRRFRYKTVAVPLGIADPVVAQAAPALPEQIAAFVRGRPIALAVGRSVPYKGFEYLIRAAASVKEDVAIVIVGTGPLQDEYRRLIDEFGLGDRVLLAGRLPEADLNALFRAASFYVMSSVMRSEAYGLVLLEAMAHRLPTIATQIPGSGVAWVAGEGETGLIVPPRDTKALAAAIDRFAGDPELRRAFAVRSRDRFDRMFTRDRMLEQILPLYRA